MEMRISAVCIALERLKTCKVTKKPTDTATFGCLFSTSLGTTATETRGAKDGSWIWRLQQPIAAKLTNFESMEEMCKVTDKPTDIATFACLFPTSLDTTASETGDCNSQSQKCTNLDKMEMYKDTDKPTDIATFACLFPTSLDTTETETRGSKDGSWIWRLQ